MAAAAAAIAAARRQKQKKDAEKDPRNRKGIESGLASKWKVRASQAAGDESTGIPAAPLKQWEKFAYGCERVSESGPFQTFITVVILIASVLVGMQTYDMDGWPTFVDALGILDWIILSIFIFEICLKAGAKLPQPWDYFTDRHMWHWNNFDFIIVVACLIPTLGSQAALLRLLRLLRVLKLLKMIVQLQVILKGLARGISSIVYIGLLLVLILYLYAIVGMMLFQKNDPVRHAAHRIMQPRASSHAQASSPTLIWTTRPSLGALWGARIRDAVALSRRHPR